VSADQGPPSEVLAALVVSLRGELAQRGRSWSGPGGGSRSLRLSCGRLRTLTGARQFCAIRSYLSTGAKHGLNFFNALIMLAEGEP
jgi:transposase